MKKALLFLISLISCSASAGGAFTYRQAQPTRAGGTSLRKTFTPTKSRKTEPSFSPSLTGFVESRPSYEFHENKLIGLIYAELGMKVAPNFTIGYQQRIQHAMRDDLDNRGAFQMDDGFIHIMAPNLWKSQKFQTALDYEGRIFLPTNEVEREKGLQFAMRNYFTFRREISPGVEFLFTEMPIIYSYSKPGFSDHEGEPAANPFFENRIYLGPSFSFAKGAVVWDIPLSMSMTKYSSFNPRAKFDDVWVGRLWIYSELMFNIAPGVTLGAAYQSGNFVEFELVEGTHENRGSWDGLAEAFLRLSF